MDRNTGRHTERQTDRQTELQTSTYRERFWATWINCTCEMSKTHSCPFLKCHSYNILFSNAYLYLNLYPSPCPLLSYTYMYFSQHFCRPTFEQNYYIVTFDNQNIEVFHILCHPICVQLLLYWFLIPNVPVSSNVLISRHTIIFYL